MSNDKIVIQDFILFEKPNPELIEKYKNKLPKQIIEIWENYGFGSFLNNYLKVVNPEDYDKLLKDSWTEYEEDFYVVFATAMGDLFVKKDEFLYFLDFRHNNTEVAAKDLDIFFFRCLPDEEYLDDELSRFPYTEAATALGAPSYDECFGYEPILAAGGTEKVENLKKVKLITHIDIITQFAGKI